MELYSLFPMIGFIICNREKIYDFLNNYRIGRIVMFPFVLPFAGYCLFKVATNEDLIMRMLESKKQKKISDYL